MIASGVRFSGATVHFVDEEYDTGPILAQRSVPVLPGDGAQDVAARVLIEVRCRLSPDPCCFWPQFSGDGYDLMLHVRQDSVGWQYFLHRRASPSCSACRAPYTLPKSKSGEH